MNASAPLKGVAAPDLIDQEMLKDIQIKRVETMNRFSISFSASEFRLLKLGLATLSEAAVATEVPSAPPREGASLSNWIAMCAYRD